MISNRWDWVKELKDDGVSIIKVGTKENMADTLTKCHAKCLPSKEFQRQVKQIQFRSCEFGRQSYLCH